MRNLYTLLCMCLPFISLSQENTNALNTALPGTTQPEYFLDRAQRLGWIEKNTERTEHSSTFTAPDGKRIAFSSAAPVNYKDANGNWQNVDIRPQENNGQWQALQQPSPVKVHANGDIHFAADGTREIVFSTSAINGKTPQQVTGRKDRLFVSFNNMGKDVSKQIEFRNGSFKYNYILEKTPLVNGNTFIISEIISLPGNCTAQKITDENTGAEFIVIHNAKNEVTTLIHPLVCYDANGKTFTGSYELQQSSGNTYNIELKVSSAWLATAAYPVIIDPLVTGPTAMWTGGLIPSCFFPNYSQDSILVTVPAAISVTDLFVTANYYADPFTTTVMGDGRMYFSTNCGQTTVFQVQPPNGNVAGTAYLEDYDLNSPLMCCMPQQCTSYTFWLSYHLSRTTNGPACNTMYMYYTTASTWPFSAYVEGYTPETYSAEMSFSPPSICATTCTVTANVYAKYGVPPFTYTHPWATSNVVFGTPAGCSQASAVKQLTLNIPNCPNYCDPNTGLNVPPPVVTDACGTVVSGYNPSYTLTIKPVPLLTLTNDTTIVCSNQPAVFQWNDCIGNATVNWGGNGKTGNSLTVMDTITNNTTSPALYNYEIYGSANGCPIPPDTAYILVYPYAGSDFTVTPQPPIVNNTLAFTDVSQWNGNTPTGYFWTFGDTSFSIQQTPNHLYTEPGDYVVCMFASSQYGCSDTICKTIQVIPANIELPNVISPNGDGSNDVLFFNYLDQYESNMLRVFNRWGNLIYEKENYTNDWKADGVSDGTYYYILQLPGDKNFGQFLHIMRLTK